MKLSDADQPVHLVEPNSQKCLDSSIIILFGNHEKGAGKGHILIN